MRAPSTSGLLQLRPTETKKTLYPFLLFYETQPLLDGLRLVR